MKQSHKFYKTRGWENKRSVVLKRDEYRCQECKWYGKNSEASTVHHVHPILVRPDLRLANWNLLALWSWEDARSYYRQLTQLGIWWRGRLTPPFLVIF